MKQRLNTTLQLALVAALCAGLAACSGGNGGAAEQETAAPAPAPASSETKEQPAAAETKSEEKFTITMLDFRYGKLPPAGGTGIQMINERFNVDWQPTYVSRDDYDQKLSVTVAGGDMPDILIMENPMEPNFYKWAAQGAFLPLDEYIDDYETFKLLPDFAINAATVNGHIYELPGYYVSQFSNTPMIRQDWLDNLGLKMPTNYEELREVALAFTNDDPDGNGKKDTYGMVMAENINPQYHFGAYWDFLAWYHKDKDGNFVPGIISDVRKEHLKFLADLYKEGAITPDFGLINWGQAYKEFYSGKGGMFIGYPGGVGPENITALKDINPNAKLAPIPPFAAPDGTLGFTSNSGMYRAVMLNAKLKDQPEKVKRILEIVDFGRRFYPAEQRNPSNADFDWFRGKEGSGYKMQDGVAVLELEEKGLKPSDYFPDTNAWAPNDAANQFAEQYKSEPLHYDTLKAFEKMHMESKHYYGPEKGLYSEPKNKYELDLYFKMYAEQTKMIVGQTPIDEGWDAMLQKYMNEGGAEMIKDVNEKIKAAGTSGHWE
ncbi:extracellular solute-binding protein [Paenibacillus sp.]|uniref:extracellular solute-binding protein n=1 Tax=Paenibacillus sp. TaxID=58172 RepID=UPI0028115460|nr:extracellular solute-binding protein [Paenibacillus sp.]